MLLQISEPGASAPKAACKQRVVGIDLGTTNSLVAVVADATPIVLGDDPIVPSVVSYDGGDVVVGRAAIARGAAHPADTVASVKRLMGRSLADLGALAGQSSNHPGRRRRPDGQAALRRRPRAFAGPGLGRDPGRAQGPGRGRPRRPPRRRGDHRAGLLRRRPAPGHPRRRAPGRARGLAAPGRADRGRGGLRPRPRHPRHLRDLRSRRRYVRHLDPDPGRRGVRGPGHRRRLGPRRRRSRPRDRGGVVRSARSARRRWSARRGDRRARGPRSA
jgi:hypothetical protein